MVSTWMGDPLLNLVEMSVFTNTFQILPDIRSGTVMNFTRPNKILQDRKNPEQVE